MNAVKEFRLDAVFESETTYRGAQERYDIYPSEEMEEIEAWYTSLNSGNIPLRAAFVLRGLKNVTIDLGGAKLVFHGRVMPFAVFDCENVVFRNFSIDYDRPFYTQGTVLEAEEGSVLLEIPERFSYRVEGQDFIACAETWEHRLVTGDMLFRCFDPETGLPSRHSGVILGLIGTEIHPRPNPPLPIHHLYAQDMGKGRVKLANLPDTFRPRVGEILAMTHEDRRKTGFLLERCRDTVLEHVRLLHIGAMGITANLCHNITLDDFSMYLDGETSDRIITINADGFHTFHCTGLMKVENCRFENLLDDAINIHGNYLVCVKAMDEKTLLAQSLSAGLRGMQYFLPGDEFVVYQGKTQRERCRGTVASADYLPGQQREMRIVLKEPLGGAIESGDCLENLRMPEIEVRNCRCKCMGGFRISSGKRVLIENCSFETASFSVAFTGDMNYWYENTGVKDVTIRDCRFIRCTSPVVTDCGFQPTPEAPFYHRGIRFLRNTVISPQTAVMKLSDVDGVVYQDNEVTGGREGIPEVELERCSHVTVK